MIVEDIIHSCIPNYTKLALNSLKMIQNDNANQTGYDRPLITNITCVGGSVNKLSQRRHARSSTHIETSNPEKLTLWCRTIFMPEIHSQGRWAFTSNTFCPGVITRAPNCCHEILRFVVGASINSRLNLTSSRAQVSLLMFGEQLLHWRCTWCMPADGPPDNQSKWPRLIDFNKTR